MQNLATADNFFRAYFHEDALVDDPDWQAVVRRFAAAASASELATLRSDLLRLLRRPDAEVVAFVRHPRCCFDPEIEGLTYRAWLDQMLPLVSDDG